MADEKFWMVWRHGSAIPAYQHSSVLSAKAEAERLARQCPGQQFTVLESIADCTRALEPVSWSKHGDMSDDRELPF